MDTNALGLAFEDRVAKAYKDLGYDVTPRVRAPGKEVDLTASLTVPGVGRVTLAIECKYRSSGTIGNKDVLEFLHAASHLISSHGFDQVVMVTNVRFSADANSAGSTASHARLLTIDELEQQSFDPTFGLISYVREYERTEISATYLRLAGRHTPEPKERESRDDDDSVDIHQYLIDRTFAGGSNTVAILGDFGAGKTTLLRAVKYDLALARLAGRIERIPLFVPLKDYYLYPSVEALLRASLAREFQRDVPMSAFWRDLNAGQFVLLLDGFDEMVARADQDRRIQLLLELAATLYGNSLAVITCRPSFFLSENDYRNAVSVLQLAAERTPLNFSSTPDDEGVARNRQVVDILRKRLAQRYSAPAVWKDAQLASPETFHLGTLSPEEVLEFLKMNESRLLNDAGISAAHLMNQLNGIYDLSDLMTRPILLDMIVQTVLSGAINIRDTNVELGASSLYDAYTASELDRNWSKGESRRGLLSQDLRRSVAERVATEMLALGSFECGATRVEQLAVEELARAATEGLVEASVEEVLTDIRTCSFMTTTTTGAYQFVHRSFQEFFVARRMCHLVLLGNARLDFSRELPQEVLYFLGSFTAVEPDLRTRIGGADHRSVTAALRSTGPSAKWPTLSRSDPQCLGRTSSSPSVWRQSRPRLGSRRRHRPRQNGPLRCEPSVWWRRSMP